MLLRRRLLRWADRLLPSHLATAEQAVFDVVAGGLPADLTMGDDPVSRRWRTEFLYSRAASIYGGSSEIQRNIISRRLLDLGDDS